MMIPRTQRRAEAPRHNNSSLETYVSFLLCSFIVIVLFFAQSQFLVFDNDSSFMLPNKADTNNYNRDAFSAITMKSSMKAKSSNSTLFHSPDGPPFRILHIVTSLSEYNTGTRSTKKGDDRLANQLLPVLRRSVETFISVPNWEADVYLILGYQLRPERKQLIVDSLPFEVGLEIWEDAIPFGYSSKKQQAITELATHALARQHRFVIKDKLDSYDFFSAWEDDMIVTSSHVENFLKMMQQLNDMKINAPRRDNADNTYGPLSKSQLDKLIPGFIRIEVVDDQLRKHGNYPKLIKPDQSLQIDPKPCCEFNPSKGAKFLGPLSSDRIMLWETDIKALGIRKLPDPIGWVAFLPGGDKISSYWSGEDGAYGNDKRPGREGRYMSQQAGFMATKSQILHFDDACPGSFLPPFSDNQWRDQSGLKPQNVEFWSGGYQLFGRCGMQRIISLDPTSFSRQLLFHSANNKQRQLVESRFVRAKDLLGQLYTVRNACIKNKGGDNLQEAIIYASDTVQ